MREVRKHGPTSVMAAMFAVLLAATPSAAERPEAYINITTHGRKLRERRMLLFAQRHHRVPMPFMRKKMPIADLYTGPRHMRARSVRYLTNAYSG